MTDFRSLSKKYEPKLLSFMQNFLYRHFIYPMMHQAIQNSVNSIDSITDVNNTIDKCNRDIGLEKNVTDQII